MINATTCVKTIDNVTLKWRLKWGLTYIILSCYTKSVGHTYIYIYLYMPILQILEKGGKRATKGHQMKNVFPLIIRKKSFFY